MGRVYCLDLRERVVAAVATGESCRNVAAAFKVSVASVVRWSQRSRATGSAAAKRMGGNRPRSLAGERDWLLARLAALPNLRSPGLDGHLSGYALAPSPAHFHPDCRAACSCRTATLPVNLRLSQP